MNSYAANSLLAPTVNRSRRRVLVAAGLFFALLAITAGYGLRAFVDLIHPQDYRSWTHGNEPGTHVKSPDGRLDAVVYCYCNTPAMVSPYFYLHILPSGKPANELLTPAIIVSRRDMQLEWIDNAHLKVDPERGTVEYFTNLWAPKNDGLPFVEVILSQKPANRLITPDGAFTQ